MHDLEEAVDFSGADVAWSERIDEYEGSDAEESVDGYKMIIVVSANASLRDLTIDHGPWNIHVAPVVTSCLVVQITFLLPVARKKINNRVLEIRLV